MAKKVLDILDLLEPETITIKDYEPPSEPFEDYSWIQSSDKTILEIAKLLPHQLSFIYSLIHEYPELLLVSSHIPGRIQEFIFYDILDRLQSKTRRNRSLERKIIQLWVKNGGTRPSKNRTGIKK